MLRMHGKEGKVYPCRKCGKVFKTQSKMREHKMEHSKGIRFGSKPTTCPECCKALPSKGDLRRHLLKAHGRRMKNLKYKGAMCPICCCKMASQSRIIKHMSTHNIKSNKTFPCHICGEWFEDELNLSNHFKHVHQGKFCCLQEQCDAKYETPAELSTHFESHEGPDKPFQCYFCWRNFTTEQFFNVHMTEHEHNLIVCDYLECSEHFESVPELNEHLNSHLKPDEKIYSCAKCSWTFLSNNDLLIHQLQHIPLSPEGKFDCPEDCRFSFRFILTLRSHYYSYHLDTTNQTRHQCSSCEYKACSHTFLKLHNLFHSSPHQRQSSDLICKTCGVTSKDQMALRIHRMKHESRKLLTTPKPVYKNAIKQRQNLVKNLIPDRKCKICGEKIKSLVQLESHMVSFHESQERSLHCWFCSERFSLQETLLLHRWSSKRRGCGKNKFSCDEVNCEEVFADIEEHEKHLQSHLNTGNDSKDEPPAIHSCPKCHLGFLNSALLGYHELVHLERVAFDGEEGRFHCPKCSEFFHKKMYLMAHYKNAHIPSFVRYKCQSCDYKTFTNQLLAVHKSRFHQVLSEEGESHICDKCGFVSDNRIKYNRHVRRHNYKTRYKCERPGCNTISTTKSSYFRHLEKDHNLPVLQHPCEICGLTFTHLSNVRDHMKNVHVVERQHICGSCGKAFKKLHHLRDHERRHNPERTADHICATCGKGYLSSNGLWLHMKSVHVAEEEKRFGCPYCPKRYHREVLAKGHVKTCMKQRGMEVPDDLDEIEVEWSAAALTGLKKFGRKGRTRSKNVMARVNKLNKLIEEKSTETSSVENK